MNTNSGSFGSLASSTPLRLIVLVALCLAVAGCTKAPETSVVTGSNGGFIVDRLFSIDGCTVYRFTDGGNPRYFTNCSGSTAWQESSGKATREVAIPGGV
jgi:hypothetical protein